MYALQYEPGWDRYYAKMDSSIRIMIFKKIEQQMNETKTRHLHHGSVFYVVEVGQYRIGLTINEREHIKTIYFVGNHKQYEKWYRSL